MKNQCLNVIITSPSLDENENVSGISSVVRGILEGFSLSGYDVNFTLFSAGKKDTENGKLTFLIRQLLLPIKFILLMLKLKPDVVHINGPLDKLAIIRDYALIKISSFFKCTIIYHIHGGPFIHKKPSSYFIYHFAKRNLQLSDSVLVLGEIESSRIEKIYSHKNNNILILPNAVKVPKELPVKKASINDELNILFMGRFVKEKGIYVLIDSLLELHKKNINFRASFYGSGPIQKDIINLLKHTLKEKFYFGGIATAKNKQGIYSATDVLVLPSLHGEGLPMVILESMAAGVPVISTPDGSIPEIVEHGINGLLVPKGDAVALCDSLLQIKQMKESGQLDSMRFSAFNKALQEYDVLPYAKRLFDIYRLAR